jgi:hypothetical protein
MPESSLYSGYLLRFEPRRTAKIESSLRLSGEAVESFSALDWTFQRREVVFLSLDPAAPNLAGVALMERMLGTGGTGKLKMRLREVILFEPAIRPGELSNALSIEGLLSTSDNLHRIEPAAWNRIVDEARRLRPELSGSLDRLFLARIEDQRLFGERSTVQRLIEERDGIGLTLDIADLDRPTILRSVDASRTGTANSILDLLDHESFHEQDIIRHDQEVFQGILSDEWQSARFTGENGRAVRVYVYDKKLLESVLGIDLLIYQERYGSLLLLQYKTMERDQNTWSYLVDSQIQKQLEAMARAEEAMRKRSPESTVVADWRLNHSPFYFKFCETTRPTAREDSLIRGITIGSSHLGQLLASTESQGKNGGRRIGYENCARYLNNTQFIDLARHGWIGSDRAGCQLITEILEASSDGGRRAMLAVIENPPSGSARGRSGQS